MGISTHILDTARGVPARDVAVILEALDGSAWKELARGTTNDDGRVRPFLETIPMTGLYRLTFQVGAYFERLQTAFFYPHVEIVFRVNATTEHYHVPLLLNPFGYSTYRGS